MERFRTLMFNTFAQATQYVATFLGRHRNKRNLRRKPALKDKIVTSSQLRDEALKLKHILDVACQVKLQIRALAVKVWFTLP